MTESPGTFQSFVGVDLHKCTVSLAAVDVSGTIIRRLKTATKCVEKIDAFIAALPQPVHLAVEACPFVEWFIDRYRPQLHAAGGRVDIADATQLAALRGKRRKTDRNDAADIATRLARGDCPLGWIADEHVSRLRKLGRQWHRLSRTLRWALGKAAGCLCRSDAVQERVRQRIIQRCGGKKAKANVAMARRLLRILFAMTRTGEVYRVGEPTRHTAQANRVRMQKQRSTAA